MSISSSVLGSGSPGGPDRSGRLGEREVSFASVVRCVTLSSVPDHTQELLALLDDTSAQRFARRLLWIVILRRLVATVLPPTIVVLHFLK
jgi:hypothetical protein